MHTQISPSNYIMTCRECNNDITYRRIIIIIIIMHVATRPLILQGFFYYFFVNDEFYLYVQVLILLIRLHVVVILLYGMIILLLILFSLEKSDRFMIIDQFRVQGDSYRNFNVFQGDMHAYCSTTYNMCFIIRPATIVFCMLFTHSWWILMLSLVREITVGFIGI